MNSKELALWRQQADLAGDDMAPTMVDMASTDPQDEKVYWWYQDYDDDGKPIGKPVCMGEELKVKYAGFWDED